MKALVVDDEGPARRRLARMLEDLGDVRVIAQLEDARALLESLDLHEADVLFLDVRMPGLDGMSLAQVHAELPPIVFVTAYDQYAASAFDVHAVDYLLKPVRPERLAAAVERVRQRLALERAQPAHATAPPPSALSARVISGSRQLLRFFDARTITRFWSADKYTVFRVDHTEHMIEEPLSTLAERLSTFGFLRVHRAELVRGDAIVALCLEDGQYALSLSDGQSARVSRRALPTLKAALGLG